MNNENLSVKNIIIENYREIDYPFGSNVKEKKQAIDPIIITVTADNWQEYFRDRNLSEIGKEEIKNGDWYIKVALDPESKDVAGFVEVRRESNNFMSINVSNDYQRRGIGSSLIREAQKDHEQLNLINFAGKSGEQLYLKMGFENEGGIDHFIWKRSG
jgi:ribosomal protein S18 acetylase RimI-like enzyme